MRSWWRHEQQSIRMALGAAAHHSAQQHAALRAPKTGTRAREGEVHVKYDAPRRQTTPHPGVRPGSLFDPGPQRSDRSLRRSAGDGLPQLVTPSLASTASEAVDSATLAFLLSQSLAAKEREERGGGQEGSRGVETATQEAQGRVHGLAAPFFSLSSSAEEDGGAGGYDRRDGILCAWYLLDFFLGREEEEKEEEDEDEDELVASDDVVVSGCCLECTGIGFCWLLRFRSQCCARFDSRFLFMRQSTVPAWFHRIWQSPVCVCCACLPVFLLAVHIRDVLRSLQLPW